jgi:hypothetical protein
MIGIELCFLYFLVPEQLSAKMTKMRLCEVKFVYKQKPTLRSARSLVVDRLSASYVQWG